MIPRLLCCFVLLAPLAACGDDSDALACVENLDPACVEGFPPTWDNVYEFVIEQRCGGPTGANCHGRDGTSGLTLYGKTEAYDGLVHGAGGKPRVIPHDPACSVLMERLETSDPELRMPLGAGKPLSAGDRCAIQKWIAAGAEQ